HGDRTVAAQRSIQEGRGGEVCAVKVAIVDAVVDVTLGPSGTDGAAGSELSAERGGSQAGSKERRAGPRVGDGKRRAGLENADAADRPVGQQRALPAFGTGEKRQVVAVADD